ncbi:putative baseplate assembly protein [Streptomyces yaizuensis]|uniref:Baseplate assembly protein n=1 Tax=Streptomyces yaizuensis TaxID=2989713 RepID=A0ABQ5NRW6_9ACTN|nr:putative baseplate assembly protein [Streptomyces sp. YSPA8]GLF93118.1 putative baseplate assembly protein [Streptomyces sp. YSPA8]
MSGFTEEGRDPGYGCDGGCDGGGCGCDGGGGGHDESRAPAGLYNPPGRTALEYRVGTHGSFLAAMVDRLASPAYPALERLTVRTPEDPAIALLDAWAVVGDLLTFHAERIADEGYLRTAKERRSLELLGRLVGYRPRPGLSADTWLAYALDRDPADEDAPVVIPRGARAASVPAAPGEEPQTFETDAELTARAAWNVLPVRLRRPDRLTAREVRGRSWIEVGGTDTGVRVGDRVLFVFGDGSRGQRLLLPVARLRVDREDGVTAIGLPEAPPPSLRELLAEVRRWITEDPRETEDGEPTVDNPNPRPVSRYIDTFDDQVLAPLRAGLGAIGTPAAFDARLAGPQERSSEAQALTAAHPPVAAWFEQLEAVFAELRERVAELDPSRADDERAESGGGDAVRGLRDRLPALRAVSGDPGQAPLLREVRALPVTAAPFGATAPLRPVQDERGRVVQQTDWPLGAATLTSTRVVFDTAGRVPVRAEFQHVERGASAQRSEQLPSRTDFALGPGRVALDAGTAPELGLDWLGTRSGDSREPGVTVRFSGALPAVTLLVSRPADDGSVEVAVVSGEPLTWRLTPGDRYRVTHGGFEVDVRFTTAGEPPAVEIGVATVPAAAERRVLALDAVHPEITVGGWVAIERPTKGAAGGIPGSRELALVTTRVTGVRTAVYTDFGITGRGTELTLADPWLDEHDVLLSTIRETTVHAGGTALRPAGEPLGDEVHGNEVELAGWHEGLRPGRELLFTGERTDVPGPAGATAAERAVIAAVEHRPDSLSPGGPPHTVLTLTADLRYRYRRTAVRILGNVVAASHGESRDEPIGSGDASRPGQSFALWQSPLTWLPADSAAGAAASLEVRVDGLLWHEVDSLSGRGPRDRVFVTGTGADGRTTVTFGDGVAGARLPTGHENVRARYRFGTGAAGNVAAGRVTQTVTRPLGVVSVTNPLPATGGADPDGPTSLRRRIPLAVSALDRLVSVADYEDFARSRAGIGRASARELSDGRRRVLHLTVAGVDDVPVGEDSAALRTLRAALARHGDLDLPVLVAVREPVRLRLAARVKVAAGHTWAVVEPALRQALLRRFGAGERELGAPARLSDVLATAHTVPGVEYVDVDAFSGTPDGAAPAGSAAAPPADVPGRFARYEERTYRVTADGGETLTSVAARHGIPLARLLRLNPDITDTRPLPKGRLVLVFRGIRPARLALLSPGDPDALVLREVRP